MSLEPSSRIYVKHAEKSRTVRLLEALAEDGQLNGIRFVLDVIPEGRQKLFTNNAALKKILNRASDR